MSTVNAPTSKSTGESNSGLATGSRAMAIIKDVRPWLYGVVVSALYAFGFLVINSNLANHGILDVEFIAARYFLAGINFGFYLLCFYLFAGRASLLTPHWINEEYEGTKRDVTRPPWSYVVRLQLYVSVFFSCCLSAAMFTSFAIGNTEAVFFFMVLGGAFIVLRTVEIRKLDLKFPRFYTAMNICTRLAAILVFFIVSYLRGGIMLYVFFTYFLMFSLIYQIVGGFKRSKRIDDNMIFSGLYAILILIVVAVAFGTLFYGKVASNLGGAKPQVVSISLSDEARNALPAFIAPSERQSLEGMLIHQTASHTYIELSGRTVRLRTADVVALVIAPEPPWQFWQEFIELRRRGFNEQERDIPKAP